MSILRETVETVKTAIESGRTDIVRSLIAATEHGVTSSLTTESNCLPQDLINSVVTNDGTFLHLATNLNQTDIVRLLLAAGADPGVQNADGQNPVELATTTQMQAVYTEELLKATAQANVGRVCQLIAAGISINAPDSPKSGNTALHWAATFANRDMVQCLLDRGANVNSVNSCGAIPLHDAVHHGDLESIRELLLHGANPLVKATKGKFANKAPLDLASNNVQTSLLLKKYSTSFINGVQESESSMNAKRSSSSLESLLSLNLENGIPNTGRLTLLSSSVKETTVDGNPNQFSDIVNQNHITLPPKPLITTSKLHQLWPQPQSVMELEGPKFRLSKIIDVYFIQDASFTGEMLTAWDLHKSMLEKLGYEIRILGIFGSSSNEQVTPSVTCLVNPSLFQISESYRLTVGTDRLDIVAYDIRGFHNAVATFIQLVHLFDDEKAIPLINIRDWPRVRYRGILLDFSSNARIPTIETIVHTVTTLAYLKINQVYVCSRFTTLNSWDVAYNSSDIIQLSHCCWKFGIGLIPAVEIDENFERHRLNEVAAPLQDYLMSFPDNGLLLLGPQLSSLLGSQMSVKDLRRFLAIPSHLTLMICCNGESSDCTSTFCSPVSNVIVLSYSCLTPQKFGSACHTFSQLGIPFGVMPGTVSCNSIAGLPEVTLYNNYQAAQCVLEEDGLAFIAADWTGTKFPLTQIYSWPGFVATAGLSWNSSISWDYLHSIIPEVLNLHVFHDKEDQLGQTIFGLGQTEALVQRISRGIEADCSDQPDIRGTVLLQLLLEPDNVILEYLNNEVFAKVIRVMKKNQSDLARSSSSLPQYSIWHKEILATIDIFHFTCKLGRSLVTVGQNPNSSMGVAVINLGITNLLPTTRTDLANRLLSLSEHYCDVWLQCNKQNGLEVARNCFMTLLEQMIPRKNSFNEI